MEALATTLLVWAVILFVLYWVIRLAVRDALEDVSGRDRSTGFSPVPSRPPGRRPGPPPAD